MARIELRGVKDRFSQKNLDELRKDHDANVAIEGGNLVVTFEMKNANKDDLDYSKLKAKRNNVAWKQIE